MPPVIEELSIVNASVVSAAVSATVKVVKEKLGLADPSQELHPGMG